MLTMVAPRGRKLNVVLVILAVFDTPDFAYKRCDEGFGIQVDPSFRTCLFIKQLPPPRVAIRIRTGLLFDHVHGM